PATDGILALVKGSGFEPRLSLSSPGYLFVIAGAWGQTPFWRGLLVNQAAAWTFLALACALLPRTWQEKAAKTSPGTAGWARALKFGGAKRRVLLRQKLLGVNPVLWLVCRERWQGLSLWAVAIVMAGGFTAVFAASADLMSTWWFVWAFFSSNVMLILY